VTIIETVIKPGEKYFLKNGIVYDGERRAIVNPLEEGIRLSDITKLGCIIYIKS
jgi:hypothetical protein